MSVSLLLSFLSDLFYISPSFYPSFLVSLSSSIFFICLRFRFCTSFFFFSFKIFRLFYGFFSSLLFNVLYVFLCFLPSCMFVLLFIPAILPCLSVGVSKLRVTHNCWNVFVSSANLPHNSWPALPLVERRVWKTEWNGKKRNAESMNSWWSMLLDLNPRLHYRPLTTTITPHYGYYYYHFHLYH